MFCSGILCVCWGLCKFDSLSYLEVVGCLGASVTAQLSFTPNSFKFLLRCK